MMVISTAAGKTAAVAVPAKGGKTVLIGEQIVFGVPPSIKPVSNLPIGAKLRLRLRNRDYARAFVRTSGGVQEWFLRDKGAHWELGWMVSQNRKEAA